ncbi:TPM domain-containing protein [Lysobacter sp. A3-1-A15]|uniref:TPM domain-containing protein n=1 Tax=Novilysobacter viscosus TaxID=3098602 RepID=UPI002ED94D7C
MLMVTALPAQELAAIPALDSPVVDTTATLDAAARARLEAQAVDLHRRKGSQLQVLVVPTTQPEDIAQYAVRVFDQWRLGREGVDDGVLLLVAKDDRRVRIEVGYGLEGPIPDATASRVVQEYLVPRFREGDYAGGIEQATGVLVGLVDGEPLPPRMAGTARDRGAGGGGNWIFALFAAVMVGQFVRAILGRAPRPFRALAGGLAAGGAAWMLASAAIGVIGGFIGLVLGLSASSGGRFARGGHGHAGTWGGFGGGHWGGGGGGFGGGGWSGGGGMSGGGGASGSW